MFQHKRSNFEDAERKITRTRVKCVLRDIVARLLLLGRCSRSTYSHLPVMDERLLAHM